MGNRIGTTNPQQQPFSYGRTDSGRYMHVPYEGITQPQVDSLAAYFDALGYNYHAAPVGHGKYRLEVEYAYNFAPGVGGSGSYPSEQTEVEDVWELVPGKKTVPILDSRNPLAMSASAQERSGLAKWKAEGTLGTNVIDETGTLRVLKWSNGTILSDAAHQLAKLLLDGVDMVEVDLPVLTHTKTVTDKYINRATFANINRIFSSVTLIASEGVPATLLFDFPTDTDPSAIAIGSPNGTPIYQTYGYGWKKNAFPVRQIGARKWQIQNTFEYDLWLLNIYGAKL
jgi:hypothetical protein